MASATVVCVALLSLRLAASLPAPGAPAEADVRGAWAREAARFALAEAEDGGLGGLAWALQAAKTQVVNGVKYYLDVTVLRNRCKGNQDASTCSPAGKPEHTSCHFEVWSQPWASRKKLVKQDCRPAEPSEVVQASQLELWEVFGSKAPAVGVEESSQEGRPLQPTAKMTTSQKHRDFVAEPMGEKTVSSLAGIGDVLGRRLEDKGFDKAYVVLGQFLVLKKDEDLFREWLKDTCGANAKQSRDCYGCLREWCDAFL